MGGCVICCWLMTYVHNVMRGLTSSVGIGHKRPGSDDQGWHTDGEHLFPGLDQHTPPHAVTVFVPLVDLSSENGTPVRWK